jgi:hypothetical protein
VNFYIPKGSADCERFQAPYTHIAKTLAKKGKSDLKLAAVNCKSEAPFCRWHGIKNTWQVPAIKAFNLPHTPDSSSDGGVQVEDLHGDKYHVSIRLYDAGDGLFHLYGEEIGAGSNTDIHWKLTKVHDHDEHNMFHDDHELHSHFSQWLTTTHPGEEVINHKFEPHSTSHLHPIHEHLQMTHSVRIGCPILVVSGSVSVPGSAEWMEQRFGEYEVKTFTAEDRVVYCKVGDKAESKNCIYFHTNREYGRQFWAMGPQPGLDQTWAIANDHAAQPEQISETWYVFDPQGRHWEPADIIMQCKDQIMALHDGL